MTTSQACGLPQRVALLSGTTESDNISGTIDGNSDSPGCTRVKARTRYTALVGMNVIMGGDGNDVSTARRRQPLTIRYKRALTSSTGSDSNDPPCEQDPGRDVLLGEMATIHFSQSAVSSNG